jgi:hypothetical protein
VPLPLRSGSLKAVGRIFTFTDATVPPNEGVSHRGSSAVPGMNRSGQMAVRNYGSHHDTTQDDDIITLQMGSERQFPVTLNVTPLDVRTDDAGRLTAAPLRRIRTRATVPAGPVSPSPTISACAFRDNTPCVS